jgi:hypothetical protein
VAEGGLNSSITPTTSSGLSAKEDDPKIFPVDLLLQSITLLHPSILLLPNLLVFVLM